MIRLTNEQWERIRNHFPEEHIPDGRPGRKPIPTRCVFEAVLWILNTGAQWHMLPQSYPNYKSVHRRFQTWCRDEVLRRVLMDVANELRDKGALDEAECFIDATFVMAKGGGAGIGPTKRGCRRCLRSIVTLFGDGSSQRFSSARMATDYVALYRSLLQRPPISEREMTVPLPRPVLEKKLNGHGDRSRRAAETGGLL